MSKHGPFPEEAGDTKRDTYPAQYESVDIPARTKQSTSGSRHRPIAMSVGCIVLLLAVASVLVLDRSSDSRRSGRKVAAAASVASSSTGVNDQPCPSDPNAPSTLAISTSSTGQLMLSAPCYAAPADTSLTVNFQNDLPASTDGQRPPVLLVITTVDKPASQPISGAPGGYEGTNVGAIFSSGQVTGESSLNVPPLSAGTYLIQILPGPGGHESRLVVG